MFTRLSLFQGTLQAIAMDVSKQQKLDADPKAIHQINFAGNLHRRKRAGIPFIIGEAKETVLYFPKVAVRVL